MWFRPAPFHAKIRKCIGPPKWRPRLRTVRIPSEPQTIPASERRTARICREHAARPSRFRHPRKFSWQFLMAFVGHFLSASLTAILMAILSCQFSWPLSSHDRAIGQRNFRATQPPIRVGSRSRSPEIGCQEHPARWNAEAAPGRSRWHVYSGRSRELDVKGAGPSAKSDRLLPRECCGSLEQADLTPHRVCQDEGAGPANCWRAAGPFVAGGANGETQAPHYGELSRWPVLVWPVSVWPMRVWLMLVW
jgi:hypothetical protein